MRSLKRDNLAPQPVKPAQMKSVVTFDYEAQQEDELSLRRGMVLTIVSKDEEGWWTGIDSNGKKGVFPFNFVKEIPADPVPAVAGVSGSSDAKIAPVSKDGSSDKKKVGFSFNRLSTVVTVI
jgi:hypothetical protein